MKSNNEILIDDYIEYKAPKSSNATLRKARDTMIELDRFVESKPFTQVGHLEIERFIYRKKINGEVRSPASSYADLMAVRAFWKWLVDGVELVHVNAAAKVDVPKLDNENPKPIPENDWKVLWGGVTDPYVRVLLGLGYFVGLRKSEILSLKPESFKFRPFPMIVDVTRKGGKTIPQIRIDSRLKVVEQNRPDLIGSAESFLKDLRQIIREREGQDRLFPWGESPDGKIYIMAPNRQMTKWCKKLKLPNYTPHQLRHSFCTNLANMSIDAKTLMVLAGHKNINTTMLYIGLNDDPLAKYLQEVDHAGKRELRQRV